jgi:hypothetical protein
MNFWALGTNVSVDPAVSIFTVELTLYIRESLEVSYPDLGVSWFGTPEIESSSQLPTSLLHLSKKQTFNMIKNLLTDSLIRCSTASEIPYILRNRMFHYFIHWSLP